MTTAQTPWSFVTSNLEPNQGDYIALATGPLGVYPVWSDGRNGDPDAFLTFVPLDATPTLASLVSATTGPDGVHLVWRLSGESVRVTLERRTEDTPWNSLGDLALGSQGDVHYDDANVTAGTRYGYRLGLALPDGLTYAGETWIDVPRALPLSLAILPISPSTGTAGLSVRVTLPRALESLRSIVGRRWAAGARRTIARPADHSGSRRRASCRVSFVRVRRAGGPRLGEGAVLIGQARIGGDAVREREATNGVARCPSEKSSTSPVPVAMTHAAPVAGSTDVGTSEARRPARRCRVRRSRVPRASVTQIRPRSASTATPMGPEKPENVAITRPSSVTCASVPPSNDVTQASRRI